MSALSQDGGFDEEQLSTEQLDSSYSTLRELVSESIHQQEAVLERVQVSNSFSALAIQACRDVKGYSNNKLADCDFH